MTAPLPYGQDPVTLANGSGDRSGAMKNVSSWRAADSLGKLFNSRIKGNFDCRVPRAPDYKS